ncbi:hypothetical protein O6H91_05G014500 [Diphasiastrum complanatum]|uniref:Uncharacterized protein n=1 Tax=Diphasiastrum complanatum TaxID=34168 RepID=A0ACC2DLC0_DIPCM|nr:hypothetical protein O6H91_05G014500 [Diphasiastrum complanatum]
MDKKGQVSQLQTNANVIASQESVSSTIQVQAIPANCRRYISILQTTVGSDIMDDDQKLQTLHVSPFWNAISFLAKLLIWSLSSSILSCCCLPSFAFAAPESIAASGLGVRVARLLRQSGWADEAIVFTLAMLPILELRGAIPVGYWMHLEPWKVYALSILGNMIPVPFILLYLDKLSSFLAGESSVAKKFLAWLFNNAREKAGPIEEFRWIGLMLFVAVPFPGTGAWTGAIIAALLGMPFWNAMWANFCGVILAGLLVNLLVTVGLKYAIIVGAGLFVISTFMWRILRTLKSKSG